MTAYAVKGPDISVWDDNNSTPQMVNFTTMRAAGAPFVFIKSSQANWADQDLIYNWANAKAAGMLRGAYHYLTYDVSPIVQADYVFSLLRGDIGELPIVCDFEHRSTGLTRAGATSALKTFLERLAILTGRNPMIYTSPSYWQEFGSADLYWQKYPLWLAHYTTGEPMIPSPWRAWHFWQFTDRADGIKYGSEAKMIDMNYWYSDLDSLYRFAGQAPPITTWEQQIDAWARSMGYTGVRP